MALFALGYRRGAATLGAVGKSVVKGAGSVCEGLFGGRLNGRKGVAVGAAWRSALVLMDGVAFEDGDVSVLSAVERCSPSAATTQS
eukprot:COSAG05_NODE_20118_length_283_cov_0.402174_1_plen_85_part_01